MELLRRGHASSRLFHLTVISRRKRNTFPLAAPLQLDPMLGHRVSFPVPDFPHTSSPKQEKWQ